MAKSKNSSDGKKIAVRVAPSHSNSVTAPPPASSQPESPKVPARIREENEGFGVIKVVVGVIIVLVIGSGLLYKVSGAQGADRGDKMPGERCELTSECRPGGRCYSYNGAEKRCLTTCSQKRPCEPGFTCAASADQVGRRKTAVNAVCVKDSEI